MIYFILLPFLVLLFVQYKRAKVNFKKYEEDEIQDFTQELFIPKGMKVYRGNLETYEVDEAKIIRISGNSKGDTCKVIIEIGYVYELALNKQNAERKMVEKIMKKTGLK